MAVRGKGESSTSPGGGSSSDRHQDSVSLPDEILVPGGNFDDDVHCAVRDALAAQSGLQRNVRGFIKLIEFVIGRVVTGFKTFFDFNVAGRTGAHTPANMLQPHIRAHCDVENAARLACGPIGHF